MGTRYDDSFKEKAVQMHLEGKSYAQVGRELRVTGVTVSDWARAYKKSDKYKPGPGNKDVYEQLRQANIEIAELRKERELLEKAAAFFAKKVSL